MANTSDKILARLKGLRARMREGEQPLFSIPAIWDNATEHQSNACDLVLTNQRLFGYIYTTFPRERLFLDALELNTITAVSIRRKSFEALFRELFVSDSQKRIYIRATSKKIEETYTALRGAIAEYAPATQATLQTTDAPENGQEEKQLRQPGNEPGKATDDAGTLQGDQQTEQAGMQSQQNAPGRGPVYSQQRIRQPLERSPLGITILLVGGLILEIGGILAWTALGNAQMGITFILTGLFAVVIATIARRQLR
jgi:hypothetical protein